MKTKEISLFIDDAESKEACALYAQHANHKDVLGFYWEESDNGCWVILSEEHAPLNENQKTRVRWECQVNRYSSKKQLDVSGLANANDDWKGRFKKYIIYRNRKDWVTRNDSSKILSISIFI